jgi:5'-nucleotidase
MTASIRIPRVLITNDDGIAAPGLDILVQACTSFADEVWVVAPAQDQSGVAQSITLHRPIFTVQQGERRWAAQGTPTDCVTLALHHFMKAAKPDLVLSGVNAGANIGDEVNLSGTLGAAFAALMFGVPAIAVSEACVTRDRTRWETAQAILPRLLQYVLAQGWRKDTCLSLNIPDQEAAAIKGYRWTRQSSKNVNGALIQAATSPRGEDYYWLKIDRQPPPRRNDDEAAALRDGYVAITTLGLDRSLDSPADNVEFTLPQLDALATEEL